ncbi:MAG TPA: hypothetical protein VJZ76_24180 [Thermoanaerobaculia bacterium]|nr:hypothetical protein [Thermoanaerobaculia bacterium]
MNKKVIAALAVTIALFSVAAARRRATLPPTVPAQLDANRSFAVTDLAILDGFSFRQTMNWIVAGSGTTPEKLVRQMFDTQNPSPGMADSASAHCDDFLVNGAATFNGFPRRCPTPEAKNAGVQPDMDHFIPLALINRFDMAPADGSNCGQYRILYSAYLLPSVVHLNLEGVLPNAHPEQGLAGCKAVAQFWADLTGVDSVVERRVRLQKFFYEGIAGFEPVVKAAHYTAAAGGSIRTRQIALALALRGWRSYEFRLDQQCPASGLCSLRFVPDVLENFPFGPMFDANVDTSAARAFRESFLEQIPLLAVNDLNRYRMNVDRKFLMVESDPVDDLFAFKYSEPFRKSQSTDAGKAFRAQIAAKLQSIGSTLTPEDIVARAETQTCNGCHFVPQSVGGGLIFPGAQDGSHIASVPSYNDANPRWGISGAMEKVFIPNRMQILRDFLQTGKAPEHSN